MNIYSDQKYVVYHITYAGDKFPSKNNSVIVPSNYIGSTSIERINKGYMGSIKSKKYKDIWKSELKVNPNLFSIKIISYHDTRPEATHKELQIQKIFNVAKNPLFVNMAYASPNGFFGMDVSKKNNPNYNNKWSLDKKLEQSKLHKKLRKQFPDKYYNLPPMHKDKNPRWKDGKTTYRDKNGNTIFTSKNDPRVLAKELIGVGTNTEKANKTKATNPNLKKYEYIIIQTPTNKIIRFEWNEYNLFLKENNIRTISQLKNGYKGYKLIEAKLNPTCKMIQPIRTKSN